MERIGIVYQPSNQRLYTQSCYAVALAEAKHRTKERPGLLLEVGGIGSRGQYNRRVIVNGRIASTLLGGFKHLENLPA